jgi:3-oxoadipate enol-lactonase
MPCITVNTNVRLHYLIDDFTDPWREAETILLLHGAAESSAVWFAWVPHLARRFRVVRPDMRGFGASTPMTREFPWSLDVIIDDYVQLMRTRGIDDFHLVGAKLGGTVARRFAARYPELVRTLTVAGTPPPRREHHAATRASLLAEFEQDGTVEGWARRTMSGRLGSNFPSAGTEWWIGVMGRTPLSTQMGFASTISIADITQDLPRIVCPALVITTEGSALGSVEQTRAWQVQIPNSRLLVLPGDSYHVAASDGDRCARETLAFIDEVCCTPRA